MLEQLGPHSGVEDGTGALLGKLQSGEYVAGFFASGSLRALIDATETGDLLNYRYLADATPLPARAVGITTAAASPNAAQVFVNYLLSEEGQTATLPRWLHPVPRRCRLPDRPARRRGGRR